ncbi:MAG: MXAN_5187 C-terminal domain-containing protein, partial [Deltaproteobacteria bacterium]
APQEEPPTARFGKPQSRRPALKREKSNPAVTPSRRAPPPITARSKGPGEARMRQIYDSYVEAKRNNNERTDKIDYESVAKSLKKMVPKLDRKHKGKRVDFKVVVKDGKVGIKPVVKK